MTTVTKTRDNRKVLGSSQRSPQVLARTAGVLYLLLGVFGGFGIMYTNASILVPGDPSATVSNIVESISLFRLVIVSDLIGQTIQVFLALALYQLLRYVNKHVAVIFVVLALVPVPIAMLNVVFHSAALILANGSEYLRAFQPEQINALVMFFLEMKEAGVQIASIFWGLWLFPMGYLVFKSGFLPKFLGILLMVGCFGYLFDFFTGMLLPDFDLAISQFTFIGEILLPLWLVIKGVNAEKWEKRALGGA